MTRKPDGCVDCSLHKSGQGFVQITIPPDTSRIRLLLEGDTPNKDEADEGKSGVGKASHWLKKNVLANAGISDNEILIDTVLRCLPPRNKKGEHYPIGKDKLAAETHCRQYDKWNEIPKRIPLLLLGGKALALRLGHDNISDYHGHITSLDGRLVGATYHPAAVMRQPNLLPVAIREASNLLEAAANPSCLARPGVTKGFVPFLQCEEFVADLEWHPGTQELTAVGVAYSAKLGYSTYEVEPSLQVIRHLMEDGRRIVGHNIIDADIPKIGALPQSWSEKHVIDTKIVAHLVHAHLAELGLLGLGDLTRFYFPTSDWKQDKADLLTYNAWDCAYNFKLWQAIKRDIDATEQWHLVEKQQTLARMTSLMQREGIRLDREALLTYARSRKEQKATAAATFPFNPNAPKQIAKWLSDEHKITVSDATFDTLAKLRGRHADIDRLIDYRDDNKSLTTWFPLEVDEKTKEVMDCGEWSFPHFNVTGTAVARFSCANPNFQNIPPHLRRFIVARDPSLEIVSFDAKNLENRTVAFQAGDVASLDAFAKGIDEYQLTAAMMLGKRFEDVTEAERATAKVTELATLYGETHWNLSKRLYGNSKKESLAEAKRLQDAYYAAHPHIKSWQKSVAAKLDSGDIMLSNPFGRKRFIYAQDSHERMKRGCHFYGCSTGADFISERMIAIWRELKLLPILQVHDELAYELDRGEAGLKLRAQIAEIFHRPVSPLNGMVLPVEAKVGRNYGKFSEDNPDGLRKVKL